MKLDDIQKFPYARLVYLLISHKVVIPNKIAKWIPGGDWLQSIPTNPASFSESDTQQVLQLYEAGKQLGEGSKDEIAALLGSYLDLLLDSASIPWTERLELYTHLDKMRGATGEDLDFQEFDLSDPGEEIELIKWRSGFEPLDAVTGGLYQGIWTVMAPPGAGKTSLLLTLAEELRKSEVCDSILMVQTEIPGALIRSRMQPLFRRVNFRSGSDKLIVASWTPGDILQWLKEHPNPYRVVILDSLDPPMMGAGEGTRHLLASAYRDLIAIKQLIMGIFVSTWPKRGQRVLTLESGSEGASKERFSDGIIGINSLGDRIRLSVIKNRFGPSGRSIMFKYDWTTLQWSYDEHSRTQNELEEDW